MAMEEETWSRNKGRKAITPAKRRGREAKKAPRTQSERTSSIVCTATDTSAASKGETERSGEKEKTRRNNEAKRETIKIKIWPS